MARAHRYQSLDQRFWQSVDQSGDCWLWTAGVDKDGYGRIRVNGAQQRTHQVSYVLHYGPIPDGMWVLHRCDNPRCVRPDHLFLGTSQDNVADRTTKGRSATGDRNASRLYPDRRPRGARHHWRTKPETRMHGERNGRAKLTADDVRQIRVLWATGQHTKVALAAQFGVTDVLIGKIVNRQVWQNLD